MIYSIFAVILLSFVSVNAQNNCDFWYAKVDKSLQPAEKSMKLSEKELKELFDYVSKNRIYEYKTNKEVFNMKPEQIQEGIECLLKSEGNTKEAAFSGATRFDVSQTFDSARVEVAALYYISYLYFRKWDFTDAVALVGKDSNISSPETTRKAYKYYREWFKKIKKIGIVKAREKKLDPLKGKKDVRWY